MGVTVHDCDPDVDIECDGCEESIGSYGAKIYCANCAGRKDEENFYCAKCKKKFQRGEMFSKIIGIMCHRCAFLYELTAVGVISKRRMSKLLG